MFLVLFVALSLCLLTLIAGTVLYIWGTRTSGKGTGIARVVGFVIMVVMILTSFFAYIQGMRIQRDFIMMQQSMDNHQPKDMMKMHGMKR